MIFRRLAQQLREQNWTAISIEFVLLVLGVFLGIQVANWNQSLGDEQRGRAYVERLTADLEHDLSTRRVLIDYYADVLRSVERANALLAESDPDPQALVIHAYRASEYSYRAPSRATWDEIVSSGDIGLLSRGFAVAAADYFSYDSADGSRETLMQSAYRKRVRTRIPLEVQQALRAGCSDVRNATQDITGFMTECRLEIDPSVIESTAAALRADTDLIEQLRYQYSDVYSTHANIQGDAAAIEQALRAIGRSVPVADGAP